MPLSDLSLLPLLHHPLPRPANSAALSHFLLCAGAPGLSCASFCSIVGLQNVVALVNITEKLKSLKVLLTGELLGKGICLPESGAADCLHTLHTGHTGFPGTSCGGTKILLESWDWSGIFSLGEMGLTCGQTQVIYCQHQAGEISPSQPAQPTFSLSPWSSAAPVVMAGAFQDE